MGKRGDENGDYVNGEDGQGAAPINRVFQTRKGPKTLGPPGDPDDNRTSDKPWSKSIPIEKRVRRGDLKPVPVLIRKVIAHKDAIGMKDAEFNRLMGRVNYMHQLECFAGTLENDQVMALNKLWGLDPLYLLDDSIPVQTPAPRAIHGDRKDEWVEAMAAEYKITADEAKDYLFAVELARKSGFGPDKLFRIVVAASSERAEFLVARDDRPGGPDMEAKTSNGKHGKDRRKRGA